MKREQLQEALARYQTPLYLYDLDQVTEQVKRIRQSGGKDIGLCFAMKANPFLVKLMEALVDRIEICSMGEYQICRQRQIAPEKMFLSGVVKKEGEFFEVLSECQGKCICNVESAQQYEAICHWGKQQNKTVRVYLRYSSGNQFGMDEETIGTLIEERKEHPQVQIQGIHYFTGTQKASVAMMEKELEVLEELFLRLKKRYSFVPNHLEYGPGLAVAYFAGQKEERMDDCIKRLREKLQGLSVRMDVTLEMGRAFVADCGYYLTRIQELKSTEGVNYCFVDGGIHQFHYDGQLKGMYQPYLQTLPVRQEGKRKAWTICGSLCTDNDVICRKMVLSPICKGDVLVLERVGAYSATEGMALFLSHPLPGVVLYSKKEGWQMVREQKETYHWNTKKEEKDGNFATHFKRN